ncbi:flagellar basal-body MS-ring/collar protein FliF [Motilimonas sp. E26]|uniref:flagellar basal-body MS-ring/collar protein FliF n=1 Tax=Motilimonas sp. E26 TaxID=2865674 RepID=UPI001E5728BC|nr:flagellar M-ring protein FliF [Motilimonas sp. E26]
MAEANQNTDLMVGGDSTAMSQTDQLEQGEQKSSPLAMLGNVDVLRQVTIIIGLAIVLAIVVILWLWGKAPDYRPLGSFQTEQLITTLDFLDQEKIPYQLEGNTILVVAEDYQQIKLRMTRNGVAPVDEKGDEILMQDMGFGVSQRLESERLKLSRERQLALAIQAMKNVQKAQVLLAIPKENVFTRREQKASATVVLTVSRADSLTQEEVDSIVDMVSSAVQNLEPSRVTVTDQRGRLLNSGSQDPLAAKSRKEFELERKREEEYRNKIDSILIPVVGFDNYTAEVDVTMDFTAVEQTQKRYNPDLPALRSEMTVENSTIGGDGADVPGALTNQPPMDANIPEDATGGNGGGAPGSSHKEATRNYELDTTISHSRQQSGFVRRLTVSVAVDYQTEAGAEGAVTRVPRTQEQLASIRRLLQGGLGFDVNRGDILEVVTVPFNRPELDNIEPPPFWQSDQFYQMLRFGGSMLVILIVVFAIIRPMLKKLLYPESVDKEEFEMGGAVGSLSGDDDLRLVAADSGDELDFGIKDGHFNLPDLHKDEDLVKAVRALVANEPDLSAQVIKDWLNSDA